MTFAVIRSCSSYSMTATSSRPIACPPFRTMRCTSASAVAADRDRHLRDGREPDADQPANEIQQPVPSDRDARADRRAPVVVDDIVVVRRGDAIPVLRRERVVVHVRAPHGVVRQDATNRLCSRPAREPRRRARRSGRARRPTPRRGRPPPVRPVRRRHERRRSASTRNGSRRRWCRSCGRHQHGVARHDELGGDDDRVGDERDQTLYLLPNELGAARRREAER